MKCDLFGAKPRLDTDLEVGGRKQGRWFHSQWLTKKLLNWFMWQSIICYIWLQTFQERFPPVPIELWQPLVLKYQQYHHGYCTVLPTGRGIFSHQWQEEFLLERIQKSHACRVTKPISKPGGNLKAANMLVSNVCQGIRCCCCRNLFWNSTFLGLAISILKDHIVQWAHSCHKQVNVSSLLCFPPLLVAEVESF